jgi:hypothetical protein
VVAQVHDHLVQMLHGGVDLGTEGGVVREGGRLELQPDREQALHDLLEQPAGDPLTLGQQRELALLLVQSSAVGQVAGHLGEPVQRHGLVVDGGDHHVGPEL